MTRHFLRADDLAADELATVLDRAARHKTDRGRQAATLAGKAVAVVFEKPSLRTRMSFELAIVELGGHAMKIDDVEIGLGRREAISDVAKVMSRYVDAIVLRTFAQARLEELAAAATVPVVNALSDHEHPCQALADLQTVRENHDKLAGRTLAWIGDGNNVAHSLLLAGALSGMHVRVAHPEGHAPEQAVVDRASQHAAAMGGSITIGTDPAAAATDADVVSTDVWTSMGQEGESDARRQAFATFQVTDELMALADSEAIFLHCLPAHRGEEVAGTVIDGPASRVFDQAENRLHAQKAILEHLLVPEVLGEPGAAA
ncbi:MAG: ornithine carbamoyltransferase [Nitriliruptorales bacterium]|nr:ornithine carbamoyltransferase [Nitriliruptorales bacterium]